MTATITALTFGNTAVAIDTLTPYEPAHTSRTIVVDTLSGAIVVGLIRARPRSGTFQWLFDTETEARKGHALFFERSRFTLVDTDTPTWNMEFVLAPGGQARLALDVGTLKAWILSVDYQEI